MVDTHEALNLVLRVFAILLVGEGLAFVLFPNLTRGALHMLARLDTKQLRFFGIGAAMVGMAVVGGSIAAVFM